MKLTKNEEDYLKALFHIIIENGNKKAGTNHLAEFLNLSAASVSSMLKNELRMIKNRCIEIDSSHKC